MLALLPVWLFAALTAHDFHFSRTDVVYSREGTWQITMRVFTDDLEAEMGSVREDDGQPIWLGDERQHPDAGHWAEALLREGWRMEVNGVPVACAFLGMEVELDIAYLYLESLPTDLPAVITLENTLFFNQFDDQVNEVHVEANGTERRELITREMPVWTYKP